jgi:3-dehydro-L-gulonate 2-dehydrogenase
MKRIPYDELRQRFERGFAATGMTSERAAFLAQIFADNTRDGIYSHGMARYAGLIDHIKSGRNDKDAVPERIAAFGAMEQWDAKRGLGPVNAWASMDRAIELAKQHGIGCVALRLNNHWMRAGTYAWQAAEQGCVGINWTNTNPLFPPFGSTSPKLGNNPIAMAVPRADGRHVLFDAAMSQYSFGKIATYARRDEPLPLPGGYDADGNLTTDARAILQTRHALAMGYWKGSGMAVMLDMIAALASGGLASHEISREVDKSGGSQVFIAIDLSGAAGDRAAAVVEGVIADLHEADGDARYPGEGMLRVRDDAIALGVPIEDDHWELLQSL